MRESNENHQLITYGKFSVEEVLKFLGKQTARVVIDGTTYTVSIDNRKLAMFKRSRVCASCGLVGQYFLLQQVKPGTKLSSRSRKGACYIDGCMHCHPYERPHELHFNLFGIRPRTGNEVLMTRDHVVPRSKEGSSKLWNLQTMCEKCNRKKGDAL